MRVSTFVAAAPLRTVALYHSDTERAQLLLARNQGARIKKNLAICIESLDVPAYLLKANHLSEVAFGRTGSKETASMFKRNRSLPLALNHNSRLNKSVARCRARRRKYKRPNAQTHGIFGTPVIIPGEDRREFQELLAELIDEWNPSGPTLRHALYSLASMWRLRRSKK